MEKPAELPSCPEFIKKQIPAFKREKNLLMMRFPLLDGLGNRISEKPPECKPGYAVDKEKTLWYPIGMKRGYPMKKRYIVGTCLVAVLLALVFGCIVYVSDCYSAEGTAVAAMAGSETVSVQKMDKMTVFSPENPTAGFLFYPGGKVEPTAYAPLMLALAERDVLCVLIPMPCNLAVLNPNAAEGIQEQFPEIENWYIGGHSLGGSMAASYGAKHPGQLKGLVLLAAYSTADLTDSGLDVLSMYGSEDGVLNMEKYGNCRKNLPETAVEVMIQGGNHASFGSYGAQDGDGEASISTAQQIQCTAEEIVKFVNAA